MNAGLVLGIDGGGSKTLVALADGSGHLVRLRRGRGSNPLDSPGWRDELVELLRPFTRTAGLAGVAAGLAAYGEVEAISAAQRGAIAEVFGAIPQRVLNDVDAAHVGAFAGGAGILILSGTGSMAWARDRGGRSYRVGGWGDAIGDEGSSHWIGRKILGLVSQSLDGRATPTALSEALFDSLGLDPADPMNSLGGWVSRLTDPRAEVAALAPLASRLAESGDAGAQGIIEAAAEELARHVTAIARLAGRDLDWSHAGGTFASAPLREAVARHLGRPPKPPRLPPIGGALLAAAQHVGWAADAQWIDRLAASLAAPAPSVNELQPTN
ncbi:MAG TPA: BadF/BadG/BcrA/BcrD ATPase family protein [Devosiaceae bacterium]|jgi:N-acetylglucosamine kinase-like BadF-type ATPase|nr:BadF/BadG/BcrA/BcrD ATPase family protein [Devosiaceae bacterium]